jgi:glycosyltransferase involved in cell wall biosynthesis
MSSRKLIYILPEAANDTHMKFNVEFVEFLVKEKEVDVYFIIEKNCDGALLKKKTGVTHLSITGDANILLRIIRLIYFLSAARLMGYKKVYIHYSFISALVASLLPWFKTYYWNCGMVWNYRKQYFAELFETSVYILIDKFVTATEGLAKGYSEFYKFDIKKTIFLPNWIDVAAFQNKLNQTDAQKLRSELNIHNDQKVLFFNQRHSGRKGAQYLPQIVRALTADCVLIVTNSGPYTQDIKNQIIKDGMLDKVRFIGKIPNDKVIEIFAITDLYLLPSDEEGMSHSMMEAMCASVPVLAFDVGANKDMVPSEYKELVIDYKKIDIYCDVMFKLINDGEKRKLMGVALAEEIKKYDKNIVLDRFVKDIILN